MSFTSAPSTLNADIAVIGRGAIGATAALAMARMGKRVALVGPSASDMSQPPPGLDNRVFALSAVAVDLLRELGVWQVLDTGRINPVHRMRVWPSALPDAPALEFDAHEAALDELACIVEGSELSRALDQALRFSPVQIVDAALEQSDISSASHTLLGLSGGRRLRCRLVLACDGAQSRARELAGIEMVFNDYPQRALVANFVTDKAHRDTAFQWFGEHGVLALLPLPGTDDGHGSRVSMVWSAPTDLADELMTLDAQALAERVARASHFELGALAPLSQIAAFPLRLGRVSSLIAPRLALAGDAAHVVHPLAGQGMNLGFGDIASLRDAISGASDPGLRPVLRQYERSRAEPVLAMRLLTDGLQGLFDPARLASLGPLAGPLKAARDIGWRAVAASGWLRRQLVAQAGRR